MTVRHASPPRYSQHTIASKAAIDFKNVDGVPSGYRPEFFKDTVEYAWLRQHGAEFGFHESWQEGNDSACARALALAVPANRTGLVATVPSPGSPSGWAAWRGSPARRPRGRTRRGSRR